MLAFPHRCSRYETLNVHGSVPFCSQLLLSLCCFVCFLYLQWQLWGPDRSVLCLLVPAVPQRLSSGHPCHSVVPQQIRTLKNSVVLPPWTTPVHVFHTWHLLWNPTWAPPAGLFVLLLNLLLQLNPPSQGSVCWPKKKKWKAWTNVKFIDFQNWQSTTCETFVALLEDMLQPETCARLRQYVDPLMDEVSLRACSRKQVGSSQDRDSSWLCADGQIVYRSRSQHSLLFFVPSVWS